MGRRDPGDCCLGYSRFGIVRAPQKSAWSVSCLVAVIQSVPVVLQFGGCTVDFTRPSGLCGNGVFDGNEACDDGNQQDGDGCSAECRIESGWLCESQPSVCSPICGDGRVVGEEVCDGADLDGTTCASLGFSGGTLACKQDCLGFDVSGCEGTGCGDGRISGDEVCDGTNLNGRSCEELGFAGGSLACSVDCHSFDTSGCVGASTCGNGIAEAGEECDGQDLKGKTCEDFGFTGGVLGCNDCRLDRSGCQNSCGNGQCEPDQGETSHNCPGDCGWVFVGAGRWSGYGIRLDGSVWWWGSSWSCGQADTPTKVSLPERAVWAGGGQEHECAIGESGTLYCWGSNHSGQLGNGTLAHSCTPQIVSLASPVAASLTGWQHTCALDDQGQVFCWGHGSYGELGNGQTEDSSTPVPVQSSVPFSRLAVSSSEAGFSCAVAADTVWCWGENSKGQLGDGSTTNRARPVSSCTGSWLSPPVQVCEGQLHTCAVGQDGTVSCWGGNAAGQLGDGTTQDRHCPVSSELDSAGDVREVHCGLWSTCALTDTGDVYCWGDMLGMGGAPGPDPTRVDLPQPAAALAVGGEFACALLADHSIWCWGANQEGELGRGTAGWEETPGPIAGP